MIVAVAVLAVVALAELAVVLHLATRRPQGTERERLLERDVARLQTQLLDAHDKLMHAVGKPWNVAPAELETDVRDEPGDDPFAGYRSHDELDEDLPLLLDPRDPMSVSL